jgi:hypothetical protein
LFTLILLAVYVIGLRVVARRYYARKHGILLSVGGVGAMRAALVGMAWPVTMWLAEVRNPPRCSHHNHVLERNRLRAEIELVEELRREEER